MGNEMNTEQNDLMTYPEAFEDTVNSIVFVPEPVRPFIMAAFFNMTTFGIF